jgi:di/tricarboxylate transporter
LSWQAWFTLSTIISAFVFLARAPALSEIILAAAVVLLMVFDIISVEDIVHVFDNPTLILIACLFIVALAIQKSGALSALSRFMAKTKTERKGLLKTMLVSAIPSAFTNNTPVVTMMTPIIQKLEKSTKVSPSKLLIPLSYATILGGMCTLLGTSTNLISSQLLQDHGFEGLTMFELSIYGLPSLVAVMVYFLIFGQKRLPDYKGDTEDLSKFQFDMAISEDSPLAGKTVAQAKLKGIPEVYLFRILRDGEWISPVASSLTLRRGDLLAFLGESIGYEIVNKISGLSPPIKEGAVDKKQRATIFEAVVSHTSSMVGKTIKEAEFSRHLSAVVLGLKREGQLITTKLKNTPLHAGDLLLVEGGDEFRYRKSRRDFYYVSDPKRELPVFNAKSVMLILSLILMICAVSFGMINLLKGVLILTVLTMLSGYVKKDEAKRCVDFSVLLTLSCAFALGKAFESTGLAATLGGIITSFSAFGGVFYTLLLLYIGTNVITEFITNNAAIILMLPVALSVAQNLGIDPRLSAHVVTIAASASFLTPIGYQTNLIVMAPGRYRFLDFFKAGLPVTLIVMISTLSIIYMRL